MREERSPRPGCPWLACGRCYKQMRSARLWMKSGRPSIGSSTSVRVGGVESPAIVSTPAACRSEPRVTMEVATTGHCISFASALRPMRRPPARPPRSGICLRREAGVASPRRSSAALRSRRLPVGRAGAGRWPCVGRPPGKEVSWQASPCRPSPARLRRGCGDAEALPFGPWQTSPWEVQVDGAERCEQAGNQCSWSRRERWPTASCWPPRN